MTALPPSMQSMVKQVSKALPHVPRLAEVFENCFGNTYSTTLKPMPDGSVFVITGDIPAMWLRDSAAQVRPYLRLAKDDRSVAGLIAGVLRRQCQYVLIDPYANAFNAEANGRCHNRDETEMGPWIWERKFELDSLCAPLILANDLWAATGDAHHLDPAFLRAAQLIMKTIKVEQRHENSAYRFQRLIGPASDTLERHGLGSPTGFTGMSWSGFRPSDDSCRYHYLVPANIMAVVALEGLGKMPLPATLCAEANALAAGIRRGVMQFGRVMHPEHGLVYAYEVDGLGQHNLMDDANVPSLLSLPYLGWCAADDPIYLNTRAMVLSRTNLFYYEGISAKGIGSPHTPNHYIWPISLCMQGLTATTRDEKMQMLTMLMSTDAGTGLMHEGFHKDDPSRFTRPWFAWANSLFAEFVMDLAGL